MTGPLSRRSWGGTRDEPKNVCVGGYVQRGSWRTESQGKIFAECQVLFQKSLGKMSGKCYRSFLFHLAAIYVGLKPSLLFDYAVLDSTNAGVLMAALSALGSISAALSCLVYQGGVRAPFPNSGW